MPTQILKEIKSRIEEETRQPQELYSELRMLGMQMVLTQTLTKAQVVGFCSDMIKLYDALRPKEKLKQETGS